jgi:hypothetical protein
LSLEQAGSFGLHDVRARKQRLTDLCHSVLHSNGAGYGERATALCSKHRVQEQERYPAAVITVEVREKNRVDGVVLDALLCERGVSDDVPKSIANRDAGPSARMHVWNRPPLPKACPEPTKRIVTAIRVLHPASPL